MPIIRVEMWSGRSKEQKAELAEVLTDAMVRIGNTSADHTIVIFQDIDKDDWAKAASSPPSSRRESGLSPFWGRLREGTRR